MASSSSGGIILDYNGVKEVLNLFNTHKEILSYLTQKSSVDGCILTNSRISTRLGRGIQGKVFDITLEDGRKGEYVVKMSEDTLYEVWDTIHRGKKDTTIDKLAKIVEKDLGVSSEMFLALNSSPDKVIHPGDKYKTLQFITKKRGCKREKSYKRKEEIVFYDNKINKHVHMPTGRMFVYPPGSYICDSGNHAEYMLSVLCGDLKQKGICNNFLDVIGFSMCMRNNKMKDYVFMEKIDGDLNNLKRLFASGSVPMSNAERIIDSIFLQTLFGLSVLNRVLGIQHNDTHTGNIFYKLTSNQPKFFKYTLDGRDIYIPNEGYIAKIGDFGYAVKYSEPMLASSMVIDEDHTPDGMPLWRADSYDMLFFAVCMFLAFGRYSRMICKVMVYIVNGTILGDGDTWSEAKDVVFDSQGYLSLGMGLYYNPSYRPTFEPHPLRPWDILSNVDLVGKLIFPTKKGKSLYRDYVVMGMLKGYFVNYDSPPFVYADKMTEDLTEYLQQLSDSEDNFDDYIDVMANIVSHLHLHKRDLETVAGDENLSQELLNNIYIIIDEAPGVYEDYKEDFDYVMKILQIS